MTDAVVTQGLGRVYQVRQRRRAAADGQRAVVALDDVSLSIPVGEIHGLLGPNGAGKTTLAKILSTILTPSSGSATVAGFDVVAQAAEVRRSIGLVLGGDRGGAHRAGDRAGRPGRRRFPGRAVLPRDGAAAASGAGPPA